MKDEGRSPERPLANHLPPLLRVSKHGGWFESQRARLVVDCWFRPDPIWLELRRRAGLAIGAYYELERRAA